MSDPDPIRLDTLSLDALNAALAQVQHQIAEVREHCLGCRERVVRPAQEQEQESEQCPKSLDTRS